jgi:hypothetical protein
MKQPARSDFDILVTEANVRVTFKPANSIYIFYRLTDPNNIASVGPVSFAGVQHARRNTGDYPSAEVQEMAHDRVRICDIFSVTARRGPCGHSRRGKNQ